MKPRAKYLVAGFISLLTLFAVLIRMQGVDFKHLQMDEYYHFSSVESIAQGQLGDIMRDQKHKPYNRAYPVTILTAIPVLILREYDPWAVLPTAIVNSLVIVFLYLYLSKYSKFAAITAGIIWTFAPLIVAMGSFVREYSFFLLFNIIFTYFVIKQIKKDYPASFNLKVSKNLAIWLVFPAVYAVIDYRTTFGNIVALYIGVFLAVLFYKMPKLVKPKKIALGAVSLLIPYTMLGIFSHKIGEPDFNILPKISSDFVNYYLKGSHSFANAVNEDILLPMSFFFTILTFIGFVVSAKSRKFEINAVATITFSYYVFYGLYYNRYFEERYYIYITIWTTLLMVIAINWILEKLKQLSLLVLKVDIAPRLLKLLALVVIFILFGNYYFFAQNGNLKLNIRAQKDFHTQKLKDYTVLDNLPIKYDSQTAIITPQAHMLLWHLTRQERFNGQIKFNDNNFYDFEDNKAGKITERSYKVMNEFSKGYFIMDKYWLTSDLKNLDLDINIKTCKIYEDETFIAIGWGRVCN